jgi:hypothetical protein
MADAATAVTEEVLETITTVQDATLKVLKGWTDTLASTPYLSEYYVAPKIDTFYGFAEKLWATEKEFFVKLLEVATEAGKKVPDAAKKTAERAASAATK